MSKKELKRIHQARITVVVPYNPKWTEEFVKAQQELQTIFGSTAQTIEHIGSTAIPEMSAKPIIDIMITVNQLEDVQQHLDSLANNNYIDGEDFDISNCRFFCKGSTQHCKVHILIFEGANAQVQKYRKFKNYMLTHPDEAKRYEQLKIDLASKFRNNRSAYTQMKSSYIQSILSQ